MRPFRPVILAALLLPAAAPAATWHVQADGTGDAPTLQAGIDSAAAGDTVLVGCGIYFEHDLTVRSDLVLRSESGDPSCATIDAGRLGRVMEIDGVPDVTIEGLTLTGGYRISYGGGVWIHESSGRIRHCRFLDNEVGPSSGFGGGLMVRNYDPGPVSVAVTHCDFSGNTAKQTGGGLAVRGLADNIDIAVSDCTFTGNTADGLGGAVSLWNAVPDIARCVFRGNRALNYGGGAIMHYFTGTGTIRDCLITGNEAWTGSAIEFFLSTGDAATVTGCTIVGNLGSASALYTRTTTGVHPDIDHTLIAFNSGSAFSGAGARFTCSDLYGNAGGDWANGIEEQLGVRGNRSVDPRFCSSAPDPYFLRSDSPCAPGNSGCGRIGAFPVACGPVSLTPESWGRVKGRYR